MKFLFLKDDTSGVREFELTSRRVIIGVLVVLMVGGVFTFLSVNVLTNVMYRSKIGYVKENNKRLVSLLDNLQSRLGHLEASVNSLEDQDKAIRTYADIPNVDEDIRQLGVGGTRYDKTTELDYLLPAAEPKVSDLLFNIDQLERKIKLERLSYEKLYDAIKYNRDLIESTPSIRPINVGYFTDGFGYRRDPFTGQRRFHYGQDISAPRGTKVYAPADGIVRYAKRRGGFGQVIAIEHGYGYETLFGHLSKMLVKSGQRVKRGDIIGMVGNTGRSTASHLHYEVHSHGEAVNPVDFFFSGYLE